MMFVNDVEFLKAMEEEFPNEDWNLVPDSEILPDIFEVHGQTKGRDGRIESFGVINEYATREDAERQVEICKTWPDIIPESIKIVNLKPTAGICKHFYKECLERIEKGEKVFPIYLP